MKRNNKNPKQKPKSFFAKLRTKWKLIVEIVTVIGVLIGAGAFWFEVSVHRSNEAEKAQVSFSYQIVTDTPFGKKKYPNYLFNLENTGSKDPLGVKTLVVKFKKPIIPSRWHFSEVLGCEMFPTPDKFGLSLHSEIFGIPSGKKFIFSILVDSDNELIQASLIPTDAKPKEADFLGKVPWEKDKYNFEATSGMRGKP